MATKWEKLENEKNQGILTFEVDEARFSEALDQAFQKVRKQVNVPGFRKGKVPRKVFEARFGVESLYQDAVDIVLPQAYTQAVEEAGIEPVDQPNIDVEQLEAGQDVIFKATVTVKPEVELGQYKDLEIPEQDFSVTDEQVDEELNQVREKQAELIVVEDEPVQEGDTAVIDFEGFIDGEAFEGGSAENHSLEIGSNSFIPGFEEQIVGMEKGEEKDVEVTFPEDYQAEDLQNKQATFKVKVNEIKRKKLPELDDDFAMDVSEFETLEEYKQDLRQKLEEKAQEDEENYKRETVVQQAADNATIEVPQAMIDTEVENMMREFEQNIQMQGLDLDTFMSLTGQDKEAMKEQFKEDAEKRVRVNLTLEKIAEDEQFEVSEDEVDAEIEKMAEMYQREKEEIKQLFEAQGSMEQIKQDLKIRKAIDFLVNNSKSAA